MHKGKDAVTERRFPPPWSVEERVAVGNPVTPVTFAVQIDR
jgi:hypothetical protein